MNTIHDLMRFLDSRAPFSLQESYDNSGLIYGASDQVIKGLLVSLDVTDQVLDEAEESGCNAILSHHPLIFSSLKKIQPKNPSHRALIKAIKRDISIISFHTNFDNVASGVSFSMAEKLGIVNGKVLRKSDSKLLKLVVFVPVDHSSSLLNSLCSAGAGKIGNYDFCSFSSNGIGTFRPLSGAKPFNGEMGQLSKINEDRIEVVFPEYRKREILMAMKTTHPYEEIAYDLIYLESSDPESGTGWIGDMPNPVSPEDFLFMLKSRFDSPAIKFSPAGKSKIQKVACCGGSGSFLIPDALQQQADALVTADIKYHQFFEPDQQLLLADIGHFESEIHFIQSLGEEIRKKSPNFAVHLSGVKTNPVHYFV